MPNAPDADAPDGICLVYAIGELGSNTVKIGKSIRVKQRLADIQRMSPVRLALRWTHPNEIDLEKRLHNHFQNYRSHGEWFTFPSDPIPLIAQAVNDRPWSSRSKEAPEGERQALSAHVQELLAEILTIPDPMERLAAIDRLCEQRREWGRQHKQEIARGLHDQGLTWKKVGEVMGGVSSQRAHQFAYGVILQGRVVRR
jgi:hypothetical protein